MQRLSFLSRGLATRQSIVACGPHSRSWRFAATMLRFPQHRGYSGGFHYGGQSSETIFAPATGRVGKAGIAVIRISGQQSSEVRQSRSVNQASLIRSRLLQALRLLTRADRLPPPRMASLHKLYDHSVRFFRSLMPSEILSLIQTDFRTESCSMRASSCGFQVWLSP